MIVSPTGIASPVWLILPEPLDCPEAAPEAAAVKVQPVRSELNVSDASDQRVSFRISLNWATYVMKKLMTMKPMKHATMAQMARARIVVIHVRAR